MTYLETIPSVLLRWWRLGYEAANRQLAVLYHLPERCEPMTRRPRVLSLRPGTVLRLDRATGPQRLEVRQGIVWLTADPATDDVLLRPGESFAVPDAWPVVVEALVDAELRLIP